MTTLERDAALALSTATFLPATSAKRFARAMGEMARHHADAELTPDQRRFLWTLVKSYRRQIGLHWAEIADQQLGAPEAAKPAQETVVTNQLGLNL